MAGPFRFDGARVIKIEGADILAPLVGRAQRATEAGEAFAVSADASADRAETASVAAQATARYFPTRAAGEAASAVNQSFSTDDGAGSIVSYRRTSGGSVEISRSITPVTLGGYAKLTGAVSFRTSGDRIGVTSAAVPFSPEALFHVKNEGDLTCSLRVQSFWPGSGPSNYDNNDSILVETFSGSPANGARRSWSISAPNYTVINAGVYDSGEFVGLYGWSISTADHRGRVGVKIGTRGRAGFQGAGAPNTAVTDLAVGLRGEIYAEAAGATIADGRAVDAISTITANTGIVQNNHAVYAEASGGLVNFSFFGKAGDFYQRDQAFFGVGAISGSQSQATITTRGGRANSVEFGSPDPAGFGSNLGATAPSGAPFIAFCAEASASGNAFRTRGKAGHVIRNDLAGGLIFSRILSPNADNQAPVDDVIWRPNGSFLFARRPRLFGSPPASATAPGEQWEIAVDADYLYVCVADNTWKRTPLATW